MKKILLALSGLAFLVVMCVPVIALGVKAVSSDAAEEHILGTGEYVRNKVKEMQGAETGTQNKIKEQVLERLKEKAKNAIANAVRRYERAKTQVENAEGITDEQKTEIKAKLDAQIASMNELQAKAEASQTVAEIKEVMTQLKTRFKYSLGLVRQMISGVYEDRLENIVEKMISLHEKLTVKVEALSDGTEKTDLTLMLDSAEAQIVSAKAKITEGNLDSAKQELVLAHETLKEVASRLR